LEDAARSAQQAILSCELKPILETSNVPDDEKQLGPWSPSVSQSLQMLLHHTGLVIQVHYA
jgi:hypothetical protein